MYRGTARFARALEELQDPPSDSSERHVRPKLTRAGLGYEEEGPPPDACLGLPCPMRPLQMRQDDNATAEQAERARTELNNCKARLDDMHRGSLQDARSRANPYESVGRGPFVNRAAVKLAELDVRLGLTELLPLSRTDPLVSFHFVDLCSGPGGFSEYLYWREKKRCAQRRLHRRPLGWGVTLRGTAGAPDFDLRRLPKEFQAVYGPVKANGDLMRDDVVSALRKSVFERAPAGVQLVTADGGAEVSSFNDQEAEMLPLLCRQAEVAAHLLAPGGCFVLKVFDTFNAATVDALCAAAARFGRVEAMKPLSSRPANSERYVVFRDFDSAATFLHPDLAPRLRGFSVRCAERQMQALRDVVACAHGRNLLPEGAAEASAQLLEEAHLLQ